MIERDEPDVGPAGCDIYGGWLPTGNRALIDVLDSDQAPPKSARRKAVAVANGDRLVTDSALTGFLNQQLMESIRAMAFASQPTLVTPI